MAITADKFLQLACEWAFEHHRTFIDDSQFLPLLRNDGASEEEIDRCKRKLERDGSIRNHYVVGGMADFELSKTEFQRHLSRVIPTDLRKKARVLYRAWQSSPTESFSSKIFEIKLGVTPELAHYLLELERDPTA